MPVSHSAEIQRSTLVIEGHLMNIKNWKLRLKQKAKEKNWTAALELCEKLINSYGKLLEEKERQNEQYRRWIQEEYNRPDEIDEMRDALASAEKVVEATKRTIRVFEESHIKVRMALAHQHEMNGEYAMALELFEELGSEQDVQRMRLLLGYE